MTSPTHTGRCLCGAVRFTAGGEPLWVAHCHCDSCRRNTGCAVATFVGFRREQVRYTAGDRKIFASSPGVRRGFCAGCGTPLTYESEGSPGEIHLYVSTLDDPGDFTPAGHVFFAERIPWLELHDDLPRYAGLGRENEPVAFGPARRPKTPGETPP